MGGGSKQASRPCPSLFFCTQNIHQRINLPWICFVDRKEEKTICMLLPFMLGNSDGLPSAVSSRSRALVCECSTSLNIECTVFLYMCCADFNAWNEQFGLLITWSESHKFVCCRLNSTMLVSLHSNELTAYAILIFACCYGCGCLRWCPAVLCCADSVCECNDSFVKWL